MFFSVNCNCIYGDDIKYYMTIYDAVFSFRARGIFIFALLRETLKNCIDAINSTLLN